MFLNQRRVSSQQLSEKIKRSSRLWQIKRYPLMTFLKSSCYCGKKLSSSTPVHTLNLTELFYNHFKKLSDNTTHNVNMALLFIRNNQTWNVVRLMKALWNAVYSRAFIKTILGSFHCHKEKRIQTWYSRSGKVSFLYSLILPRTGPCNSLHNHLPNYLLRNWSL